MLSLVTGRGLLSWQRLLCGVDDAVYDVVIGNWAWSVVMATVAM